MKRELGARKLRELSADDVDRWLVDRAESLSTDTLRQVCSILKRAVSRAQARDKVKRNVVLPCDVPEGRQGRPSKSLRLRQASAVLTAAEGTTMYAYVVLSPLIFRLVGHNNTEVTETVYRKQIRPVLLAGAEAIDGIFEDENP